MYRTVPLDLSAALTKRPIVERAIPVEFVNVRETSDGAVLSLHFGEGGEAVPVYAGDSFDLCTTDGIYVTSLAQAGASAKIFVSGSGGPRDTGA